MGGHPYCLNHIISYQRDLRDLTTPNRAFLLGQSTMSDQSDAPIISEPPQTADDTALLNSLPPENLITESPWDTLWRRVAALEKENEERRAAILPRGTQALEKAREKVVPMKTVAAFYNEFLSLLDSIQKLQVTHGERIGQIKLLEQRVRQALTALPYEAYDDIPF